MSEPAPGRMPSLGSGIDLADAAAILTILRGCAAAAAPPYGRSAAAARLARLTIAGIWDEPRLRHLVAVDGRYGRWPRSFPWSPGAQRIHHDRPQGPGPGALVLEHLVPFGTRVQRLFRDVDAMDPAGLVEHLGTHNVFAVITRDEDRLLTRHGRRSSTPDPDDAWARYRGVPGFPAPETFGPLGPGR